MLNKYLAYHKKNGKFYPVQILGVEGMFKKHTLLDVLNDSTFIVNDEEVDICEFITHRKINDNESIDIYENSTVIEFEWKSSTKHKEIKQGYFKKDGLYGYLLMTFDGSEISFSVFHNRISKIKKIDTLQENKTGLVPKDLPKEKCYYQICLRHSSPKDNVFLFHADHCSGYSRAIEKADLFSKDEIEFPEDFREQVSHGDFYVHKDVVDLLIDHYSFSDKLPLNVNYAGMRELTVLPNTGQVRRVLGITTENFILDGENRNYSFSKKYPDTVIEKFKKVVVENKYRVQIKPELYSDWGNLDDIFDAESRSSAISQAYSDWHIAHEDISYFEFKSMVLSSKHKIKVLDKWVKVKGA